MNLLSLELYKTLAVILGIGLALSFCFSMFFKFLKAKSWFRHHFWTGSFLKSIEVPIQLLIWLNALVYVVDRLGFAIGWGNWSHNLIRWQHLICLISASWLLLNWKKELEHIIRHQKHFLDKSSSEKATIDAISHFITIVILALSGLMALQILGVPIESLLAISAVGAAGVAWAGTDVMKNFFGGLMIHITRPFACGDWINSPEKEIEGVVEEIGWYQTRIRTFDKRPIYVPNGLFPSLVLRNPSRMNNRRITADIGLRYEDINVLPSVISEIEKMLKSHSGIDQTQLLMVHFTNFNSYSLGINIYCFTRTTDWAQWRNIQQDVFLKIARIIEKSGGQITIPSQILFVKPSNIDQAQSEKFEPHLMS